MPYPLLEIYFRNPTQFFTKIAEKKRSKMCSKSVPDSGAGGNEEFLEYGEKM